MMIATVFTAGFMIIQNARQSIQAAITPMLMLILLALILAATVLTGDRLDFMPRSNVTGDAEQMLMEPPM